MKERPTLFSAPMVRAILEGRKTVTRRVVKPYRKHPIVNLADAEPTLGYSGRHNDPASWGYEFLDDGAPAPLSAWPELCPYGQPGDQMGVKETFFAWGRWETRFSTKKGRDEWHFIDMTLECGKDYLYAADGVSDTQAFVKRRSSVTPIYWKRPAIFMPRAVSRITPEVTGVRVDRLQDITPDQAISEGIEGTRPSDLCTTTWRDYSMSERDPFEWFGNPVDSFRSLWESINGAGSWDANPWVWVVEFKRIQKAYAEATAA